MPKRTNEFQQLVVLIHKLFAPEGAQITESALLGTPPREVDILVEYETDLYPIKIAVEAKDEGRPLDVGKIETYIGKYNSVGGIKVDKVIIVGKAFSKTAVERANQVGFDLHTLNSLESIDVGQFTRKEGDESRWVVSSRVGNEVELTLLGKNGEVLLDVYKKGQIFSSTGDNLGKVEAWARLLLDNQVGKLATEAFGEFESEPVHVTVDLQLPDHYVKVGALLTLLIGIMRFDFGERVILPDMNAKRVELGQSSGKVTKLMHYSGKDSKSKVQIIHEDAGEHAPSSIRLDGISNEVKRITIRIE